jgi:5-methylcytosine-specific restriction protein A
MPRWRNDTRRPWEGSDRKSRLPVDWDRLRQVVLKRCGFRCEWTDAGLRCPAAATDVDHITAGDDSSLSNLQGLCGKHHLTKTSREANAVQAERRKLLRLPEEKQPGVIDGPPRPTPNVGF